MALGEILMRFTPSGAGNWESYTGGSEFNVLSALSKWNIPTEMITAVSSNSLGERIMQDAKMNKVGTKQVIRNHHRQGIYFLESGNELGTADVIYDRNSSAFSTLSRNAFNWKEVFSGCTWFHISAITPALNETLALVAADALQTAKKMNITTSVDLNYRSMLWQYNKKPPEVMNMLMPYCDVVMGNIWSAEKLLGISSAIGNSKEFSDEQLLDAATQSILQLSQRWKHVSATALTFRLSSKYMAVLQQGEKQVQSKKFILPPSSNNIGSGDCFMAGIIYGMQQRKSLQNIVDFASAAAIAKLQEKTDTTRQTIEQINKLL